MQLEKIKRKIKKMKEIFIKGDSVVKNQPSVKKHKKHKWHSRQNNA